MFTHEELSIHRVDPQTDTEVEAHTHTTHCKTIDKIKYLNFNSQQKADLSESNHLHACGFSKWINADIACFFVRDETEIYHPTEPETKVVCRKRAKRCQWSLRGFLGFATNYIPLKSWLVQVPGS